MVAMRFVFFFSSRRRHTRCALVTGVQTVLFRSYPWNTAPRASQDVDGLQALVRVDLGGADLTSTTSFRKRTSEYDLDNDAISPAELARARAAGQIGALTPLDASTASYVVDTTDNFSQEIPVRGAGARLTSMGSEQGRGGKG